MLKLDRERELTYSSISPRKPPQRNANEIVTTKQPPGLYLPVLSSLIQVKRKVSQQHSYHLLHQRNSHGFFNEQNDKHTDSKRSLT